MKKQLLKNIGWLFTLSVILLTACQKDETLLPSGKNNLTTKSNAAIAGYNYLANPNGVFVLAEGNMTDENGTLSFIDASGSSSTFPAQNWVFGNPASLDMGNVSQDLFIANNKMYIISQNGNSREGAQHILILNSTLSAGRSYNPNTYFSTGWSSSGPTPTHLAVDGKTIFIRTNNGLVTVDTTNFLSTPVSIGGIVKPSRTRMAMVKNNGVKYLYVGSEQGTVYRINTSTKAVTSIAVEGKVAGLVAVRRNNNASQYVYALSIVSATQAKLYKISGDTPGNPYIINAPFDAGLFIPSVGLCCYAGGTQDILYFRSNGWNPTKIYKYETATGTVSDHYTVPAGIDPNAQIIYGDLAVDQRNGDLYFGYVGNWGAYKTVNGVARLRGGSASSIQEYKATGTGINQIDTRFTSAIYFTREFDM